MESEPWIPTEAGALEEGVRRNKSNCALVTQCFYNLLCISSAAETKGSCAGWSWREPGWASIVQVGILSVLISLTCWALSPLGWVTLQGKEKWHKVAQSAVLLLPSQCWIPDPGGLGGEGVIALLCGTFCLWWWDSTEAQAVAYCTREKMWCHSEILVRINHMPATALSSWFFLSHIKPSL